MSRDRWRETKATNKLANDVENYLKSIQAKCSNRQESMFEITFESMMGHYWIGKNCCRRMHLSAIYFTMLIIQAVVIVQFIVFFLLGYLKGAEVYSATYSDLNYVLHFDFLIPLIVIQISWFVSAASTIYSMYRIIPYLMLPHLLTSLILLIASVLLITLTTYHITKGLRFNCSLMLLLMLSSLYSFGSLYSIYLTLSCFRLLIRKRSTVASIAENEIRKEALEDQEISSINTVSYSRRSTVIINDDYINMINR